MYEILNLPVAAGMSLEYPGNRALSQVSCVLRSDQFEELFNAIAGGNLLMDVIFRVRTTCANTAGSMGIWIMYSWESLF